MRRFALAFAAPRTQLIVNVIFAIIFLIQIPYAELTSLKESVPYLVFLSLWALVDGHWSAAVSALAAMYADPETPNPGEGTSSPSSTHSGDAHNGQ